MNRLTEFGESLMWNFYQGFGGALRDYKDFESPVSRAYEYGRDNMGTALISSFDDIEAVIKLEMDVLTEVLGTDIDRAYVSLAPKDGLKVDDESIPFMATRPELKETSSITLDIKFYEDGSSRTKVRDMHPTPKRVNDMVSVLTGLELAKNHLMSYIKRHETLTDKLIIDNLMDGTIK